MRRSACQATAKDGLGASATRSRGLSLRPGDAEAGQGANRGARSSSVHRGAGSTPPETLAFARSDGDRRRYPRLVREVHQRLALAADVRVAPKPRRRPRCAPPAWPAAARRAGAIFACANGSYGEFGQKRSRPRAKRGAERPLPLGNRLHALERRQRLIAADCEHPRMVGALLHDDAGALLALHDRCRRRPGHDATGHTGGRPVAAVVRAHGTLRSAVRGVASLVAVDGPRMAPRAATGQ